MHNGRMWSFQNTWGNAERPLEGPEHPGCVQWHTARLSAPHKNTCKPLLSLQTDIQSRPPLGADILVPHILANPILAQLNVPQRDRSQDSKLQRSLVLVQRIVIPVQISLARRTDPQQNPPAEWVCAQKKLLQHLLQPHASPLLQRCQR